MRSRLSTDLPFTCVTCGMEITGHPTFYVGLPFCCAGCVADGPCTGSYDTSPNDSRIRERLDAGVVIVGEAPSRVLETVAGRRH